MGQAVARAPRFRVEGAAAIDDGWIVVGDARDACSTEVHAVAYIVKGDGSVQQLWRDSSPFSTSARGVRRTGDAFEIIGYAERAIAVAEVVNSACSACYMQLRPQVVLNVKKGDEIIVCENCSRILYMPRRGSEETA